MRACELGRPERLRAFLALQRRLFEVRADGQGGVHWQQVDGHDHSRFAPPEETPPFSAKAFFFAERELLFRFDGGSFYAALPEVAPQVLFGVHACDLEAVAYQDRFFASDPHYRRRREATLLVGIDCLHSCQGGFCTLLDSGPQVRAACADLILLPRDDPAADWLLLVTSAKGEAAVAGLTLEDCNGDWQAERTGHGARVAVEQAGERGLLDGITALNAGQVASETWEDLGLRCLGCSGCTSVCPTCSCFAPRELPGASGGVRHERIWDSCLYQGFQKEASGHNPSATPGQRVQRFWFHKFGDAFKADFQRYGCVGCGRCDRVCPGGIGVHRVMHEVAQSCST